MYACLSLHLCVRLPLVRCLFVSAFAIRLISVCFRRLDEAEASLRALAAEIKNEHPGLEHQTQLFILCRTSSPSCVSSASLENTSWIKWEEELERDNLLPRLAVLVEASDPIVLRKKSSFYHQALTLIGKLIDEFSGEDC
ncbi:hypothetical protein Emag_002608 [Eimeria magna]